MFGLLGPEVAEELIQIAVLPATLHINSFYIPVTGLRRFQRKLYR